MSFVKSLKVNDINIFFVVFAVARVFEIVRDVDRED